MSKATHTPGPWAWQKFGSEFNLTGQHGMRPIVLGVRGGRGQPRGQRNLTSLVDGLLEPLEPEHPDARLIAAAPELLDALRSLHDLAEPFGRHSKYHERSQQAFKRAAELLEQFGE